MKLRRLLPAACMLLVPFLFTIAAGSFVQRPAAAQAAAQNQQHPLLDALANKVIQKYQTTPCAQLKMQKADKQPPSQQEQKVIQFLKSDPQLRTIFINKVAAPIANRMFECGMIP